MTGSLIALILAVDVIVGWLLADAVARRADRDIARQIGCAAPRVLTEVDAGLPPAFLVAGDDGGDVGRVDAVEVQVHAAGSSYPAAAGRWGACRCGASGGAARTSV